MLAAPGEAAAPWHCYAAHGAGEPLLEHEMCPNHRGNVPGTGLSCLCPAWLPRPQHHPGSPPKDDGAVSSLPAAGREGNSRQTQAEISQAVISRNWGQAVSRQAAALGGCWMEWHFPPRFSRDSLHMIKIPFSPLGLLFSPGITFVPDQAFLRFAPLQHSGIFYKSISHNLPLLSPGILLLSWGWVGTARARCLLDHPAVGSGEQG